MTPGTSLCLIEGEEGCHMWLAASCRQCAAVSGSLMLSVRGFGETLTKSAPSIPAVRSGSRCWRAELQAVSHSKMMLERSYGGHLTDRPGAGGAAGEVLELEDEVGQALPSHCPGMSTAPMCRVGVQPSLSAWPPLCASGGCPSTPWV